MVSARLGATTLEAFPRGSIHPTLATCTHALVAGFLPRLTALDHRGVSGCDSVLSAHHILGGAGTQDSCGKQQQKAGCEAKMRAEWAVLHEGADHIGRGGIVGTPLTMGARVYTGWPLIM